jgi:hypothetical protein
MPRCRRRKIPFLHRGPQARIVVTVRPIENRYVVDDQEVHAVEQGIERALTILSGEVRKVAVILPREYGSGRFECSRQYRLQGG